LIRCALAIACLASLTATAWAGHCQPHASLDGDSVLVARVASELSRLGVATTGDAGACPIAHVAVGVDRDGMIVVAVREGTGSEHRAVSDATVAAMWIDSWLRDDLDGAGPAEVAPPAASAPRVDAAVELPPRRTIFDRAAISVAYEETWSDTHAPWNGIDVSACARLGALCFGGRARYASTTVVANDTAASRNDISALATASYERAIGRVGIAGEVGLGVGLMTTKRIDGCATPPPCPEGMTCEAPSCAQPTAAPDAAYVGDGLDMATVTPRAEGALRVAVPLWDHVWLDGIAAVTASAFAHTSGFLPGLVPAQLTTAQVTVPGEPVALFSLGIGLRVGAP
jgi:hypothetical protein